MDGWICALCLIFDLNYKLSFNILKKKDYINELIDKVEYKENQEKMEKTRKFLNNYIKERC